MPALAITDHGTMSGVIPFYKACQEEGVKPILGCKLFVVDADRKGKPYSIVLLAENNTGYHHLIQLVTNAQGEDTPAVSKDFLRKYSSGLIALSSGLSGEIAQTILRGTTLEVKRVLQEYIQLFGKDNFFLEIHGHNKEEQQIVNKQCITLSEETGIGIVLTNDVRYMEEEDLIAYQCISCIRTGAN
jgi:DNA polymerase-3 subunit alpha